MSEPSKRYVTDYFATSKPSSGPGLVRKSRGFPELSDDIRAKLETAPRLARKHISDGYKVQNCGLPSYQGNAIGPTGPSAVSNEWCGKISLTQEDMNKAARSLSLGSTQASNDRGRTSKTKRRYSPDDDTDDDSDEYQSTLTRHIFIAPGRGQSLNSALDDGHFEPADFLMPREVVFKD